MFVICKSSEKKAKMIKDLKRKIFFNPFIRYIFISYLKLSFAAMVVLKLVKESPLQVFAAYVILLIVNLVPILLAYLLYKNKTSLDELDTKLKFGSIYALKNPFGTYKDRIWVFPLAFFYRRALFSVLTVVLLSHPLIQMQCHIVLSVATLCYIIYDRHFFETKMAKLTEVMSELLLLLSSALIMQFMRPEYSAIET